MLFKRKSEEERSERHFTLTRRIYYIYIFVTVYDLFMYLAGLVSVLSRPAAQTEIMDTGTHLWFYIMDGNFVRFPKEYLPFEVDAPSVDGKLFAAAFLLLTFIANKLPIFFIVWKGYRILRAMKRSYTPFVPEIAEHICWIGRTALFIGLFGKMTIQGVIRRGCTVMVDVNGNYTGYMTDMTRTYRLGDIPAEALRAHELSREICRRLAEMGTPGRPAREMYETALGMAREAGLEHRFMGHRQQAGFVGHGLGIEINEAPVIAPRSRDILAEGMCIALEPKFVIAGVGAVGIENTYVVRADGRPMECITNAPEEIIDLDK